MKKIFRFLVCSAVALAANSSFAQEIIPVAPANLKIDGKLDVFSDSLANYDKSSKIHYAFAHDANNLYVFIKANGQQEQSKIMAAGISVSVNNKGKKKETSTITFPVVDKAAMVSEWRNKVAQSRNNSGSKTNRTPEESVAMRKETRNKMLNQYKEIKVSGLEGISMESVSIYNNYGLKTGINFDAQNNLIYELAIPLKLVRVSLDNEIAINIKLNGIEIPENRGQGDGQSRPSGGYGGGRSFGGGGYGGGRYSSGQGGDFSSMFTSSDFWVKAKFAQ
ncbi:MAG: hypothetical protein IE931_05405 [Sphingobacteriales bacterium]|nr:hypothetical protein [Sphingobacteriales bacterium]